MDEDRFKEGVARGVAGKGSASGLGDHLADVMFPTGGDAAGARDAGYRAGVAAKATADAIRASHASDSAASSGSSGGSLPRGPLEKSLDWVFTKVLLPVASQTWKIGAVLGAGYGIYWGLDLGGPGKALIFGVVLGIGGAIAGALVPFLATFAVYAIGYVLLVVGVVGGLIWLWNL